MDPIRLTSTRILAVTRVAGFPVCTTGLPMTLLMRFAAAGQDGKLLNAAFVAASEASPTWLFCAAGNDIKPGDSAEGLRPVRITDMTVTDAQALVTWAIQAASEAPSAIPLASARERPS